jgi:hypothetical protein
MAKGSSMSDAQPSCSVCGAPRGEACGYPRCPLDPASQEYWDNVIEEYRELARSGWPHRKNIDGDVIH